VASPAPPAAAPPPTAAPPLGAMQATAAMRPTGGGVFGGVPVSDAPVAAAASAPAPLTSDARLQLSVSKTAAASAAELAIGLRSSGAPLRSIAVALDVPLSLRLSLSPPAPPASGQVSGPRCSIAELHAAGATSVGASVTCATAAAAAEQHLLGQVCYTEALSGDSHVLSFQLPLRPSDLLRPHKLSTQQFGAMWPAHAAERKTVVTTAAAAAAPKYSSLVGGAMHLAAVDAIGMEWSGSILLLVITGRARDEQVDTIGMECISAGRLAGSEHTVLVHAKLGLMQGRASSPVQSSSQLVPEPVHQSVQAALSSSPSAQRSCARRTPCTASYRSCSSRRQATPRWLIRLPGKIPPGRCSLFHC